MEVASGNSTESVPLLRAGTIAGAYGIKGWVKIHALTDPVENLLTFERCYIRRGGRHETVEFEDGRAHGKGLIAKLAGVDTRTDAEQLRGLELWVPAAELPALEAGDYYWHQLQGLQVWCEHDGDTLLLGEVDHLLETGANDVLVLRPCVGSIDERERLIPYLPEDVVLAVDREAGRMTVSWHPED
jgi:16S rRNA processing protein RimM